MNAPLHIPFQGDLYEIRYEGTILTSIQKWYCKGSMVRDIQFDSLPKEVQQQIINHIRSGQKTQTSSKRKTN